MGRFQDADDVTFYPIQIEKVQYYDALSINDIIELSNGMADVIYFPDGDVPKEIKGKFTTGIIKTPEDAATALSSVREVMFIEDISFICIEIEEREEIKVFHLQQVYQGAIVLNGTFRVIATHDGEPVAVIGQYISGIVGLDTTPKLTASEARKSIRLERGTNISASTLILYKDYDDVVYLCWKFTIKSRDPLKEKEIIVDADTGKVLANIPFALF